MRLILILLLQFAFLLANGQAVKTLEKSGHELLSVTFSPDGKFVASGGNDNMVIIWNVATKAPVHVLRGHTDYILTTVYSPDGKYLATGGKDNSIIIWSVA